MNRAVFLATVALLVMLILAPMALAQGSTTMGSSVIVDRGVTTIYGRGAHFSPPGSHSGVTVPQSGGPAIVLPAAVLLLGSGILTYAILRRR